MPEKSLRCVSVNAIVVLPGRGSGRLRAMAAFVTERMRLSGPLEGVLMGSAGSRTTVVGLLAVVVCCPTFDLPQEDFAGRSQGLSTAGSHDVKGCGGFRHGASRE